MGEVADPADVVENSSNRPVFNRLSAEVALASLNLTRFFDDQFFFAELVTANSFGYNKCANVSKKQKLTDNMKKWTKSCQIPR